MARAPVSKTGGCRFEVLPLLPVYQALNGAGREQKRVGPKLDPS